MIGRREPEAPDSAELRAAGLAGLAAASAVYLPAHAVVSGAGVTGLGPQALVAPFVAGYIAGVVLSCLFRASRSLAPAAALVAGLAGVALGGGDPERTAVAVIVMMLLALRVVGIGLRNWRIPMGMEIGVGAALLGFEAIVASSSGLPEWRALLVVLVPVFFVASLASRATTVWTRGTAVDLDERVRSAWIRRSLTGTGALIVASAVAVALSVRGGLLERLGVWLAPVAGVIVGAVLFVVIQFARPFFWLVERIGLDPEALQDLLDRLRDIGPIGGIQDEARRSGPSLWARLIGLLVLVAVGISLYRVLRRLRPRPADAEPPIPPVETAPSEPLREEPKPSQRRRLRRELPADAVRRRYAEVLLALRRRGLAKDPWATPAEFVPVVAHAFPGCSDAFLELTRAYQDVRYGNLRVDSERLRLLDRGQERILAALRHA